MAGVLSFCESASAANGVVNAPVTKHNRMIVSFSCLEEVVPDADANTEKVNTVPLCKIKGQ